MDIVFKLYPEKDDVDAALKPLIAFNRNAVGDGGFQPFAVTLNDPATGEAVGGLAGISDYDWLILHFLFVPEALRGRGHGRALVERAEAYARERDLVGVWADIFSFQARPFYERLGYSVFGTLDNHPRGSQRHFMQKRFETPPP